MKNTLLILVTLGFSITANAEFYAWTDRENGRHVSNIPAEGFTDDGKLKDSHNPHTIDYQYQDMLERLRMENLAIEEERARKKQKEEQKLPLSSTPRPRLSGAPKEGLMGLQELIELGKRGGRAN